METKNAKITGTTLGFEDHGIFTCFIHLDYGGVAQSFGGYFLEHYPRMIQDILKTVGVESWEELSGKYIRVMAESHKIYKIGHVIKEIWYTPES
jgi:hypothetical protein